MKKLVLFLTCTLLSIGHAKENLHLLTVPKAGSHLVDKLLHLIESPIKKKYRYDTWCHPGFYKRLPHLRYQTPDASKYIYNHPEEKKIIIVRDIRACVVSAVFYIDKLSSIPANHQMEIFKYWKKWASYSMEEKLNCVINNHRHAAWNYLDIIDDILMFIETPNTFVIRFEDIVGSQGGGSDEAQLKIVTHLIKFLGLDLSNEEMQDLISKIYGKDNYNLGNIFRKGQINDWVNYLTDEQLLNINEKYGYYQKKFGY